jgi:hypothetical protein
VTDIAAKAIVGLREPAVLLEILGERKDGGVRCSVGEASALALAMFSCKASLHDHRDERADR